MKYDLKTGRAQSARPVINIYFSDFFIMRFRYTAIGLESMSRIVIR